MCDLQPKTPSTSFALAAQLCLHGTDPLRWCHRSFLKGGWQWLHCSVCKSQSVCFLSSRKARRKLWKERRLSDRSVPFRTCHNNRKNQQFLKSPYPFKQRCTFQKLVYNLHGCRNKGQVRGCFCCPVLSAISSFLKAKVIAPTLRR